MSWWPDPFAGVNRKLDDLKRRLIKMSTDEDTAVKDAAAAVAAGARQAEPARLTLPELRWVRLPPRLVPFDGPVGEHGEVYVHAADVLAALFDDVDDVIAALGRILTREPRG